MFATPNSLINTVVYMNYNIFNGSSDIQHILRDLPPLM